MNITDTEILVVYRSKCNKYYRYGKPRSNPLMEAGLQQQPVFQLDAELPSADKGR